MPIFNILFNLFYASLLNIFTKLLNLKYNFFKTVENASNIGKTIAFKNPSYDLATFYFLSHIGDIGTLRYYSKSPYKKNSSIILLLHYLCNLISLAPCPTSKFKLYIPAHLIPIDITNC